MRRRLAISAGLVTALTLAPFLARSGICAGTVELKPVDKVVFLEIHGDDTFPLGENNAMVKRLGNIRFTGEKLPPLSARGIATLVEVTVGNQTRTILLDTGGRGDVLRKNFAYFNKDATKIEAIALTHGHSDHYGGMKAAVQMIRQRGNHKPVPIYVGSEEAFGPKYFRLPNGALRGPWEYPKKQVENLGGVHIIGGPQLLLDGHALYSGTIPFQTSYENILPNAPMAWVVLDEYGNRRQLTMHEESVLVFNIKGKGLLVMGGCTHRGSVNSLLYARQLTGNSQVAGYYGCYPTVSPNDMIPDIVAIHPAVFIGAHCFANKPDLTHALRTQLPGYGIHYYESVTGSQFTFAPYTF